MQWTSKKCTKKRDKRAELLFWSLNLLFFWSRRCGSRRGRLSSLMSPQRTWAWQSHSQSYSYEVAWVTARPPKLPKVHFGNNSRGLSTMSEWSICVSQPTAITSWNTLREFRSYWKAIITGSLAGYIKIIPTGDPQKFPFKKKTRCQ